MTVQNAPIDNNDVKGLIAASNVDGISPVKVYADPVTHRLLVDLAGGSGTVTSVSVVSANGFAGTVATATTTPAITLSTTVTGILKGNGTAISSAASGTDYVSPGAITTSGLTMSTAKILGRATAGTGAIEEIAQTGTGSVVFATSPSITTPKIVTSINDTNGAAIITLSATASAVDSLQIANSATGLGPNVILSTTGSDSAVSLTLSPKGTGQVKVTDGTDTTKVVAFDASGTTTNKKTTLTFSNTLDRIVIFPDAAGTVTLLGNSSTGSGSVVLANTPTLITPVLGAATATSINGNTFTTGTYTLTGTASKTLNFTNTLTLSGTDSTTMTFPSTSATIARTDAAQTFTGIQTIPQIVNTPLAATVTSNAATITRASRINNFTNSSAATMAITLSTTGALDGDLLMVRIYDFSAVAQTIGWTNTEDSTVAAPTTSNGSTTLPLTVGFQYNGSTSKWRTIAKS